MAGLSSEMQCRSEKENREWRRKSGHGQETHLCCEIFHHSREVDRRRACYALRGVCRLEKPVDAADRELQSSSDGPCLRSLSRTCPWHLLRNLPGSPHDRSEEKREQEHGVDNKLV
eukprot:1225650-Rhodomonas_salina.1